MSQINITAALYRSWVQKSQQLRAQEAQREARSTSRTLRKAEPTLDQFNDFVADMIEGCSLSRFGPPGIAPHALPWQTIWAIIVSRQNEFEVSDEDLYPLLSLFTTDLDRHGDNPTQLVPGNPLGALMVFDRPPVYLARFEQPTRNAEGQIRKAICLPTHFCNTPIMALADRYSTGMESFFMLPRIWRPGDPTPDAELPERARATMLEGQPTGYFEYVSSLFGYAPYRRMANEREVNQFFENMIQGTWCNSMGNRLIEAMLHNLGISNATVDTAIRSNPASARPASESATEPGPIMTTDARPPAPVPPIPYEGIEDRFLTATQRRARQRAMEDQIHRIARDGALQSVTSHGYQVPENMVSWMASPGSSNIQQAQAYARQFHPAEAPLQARSLTDQIFGTRPVVAPTATEVLFDTETTGQPPLTRPSVPTVVADGTVRWHSFMDDNPDPDID